MQNLGLAAGSAVGPPPGGLQAKILRILQRSPQPLTPHDLEKMTVRRCAPWTVCWVGLGFRKLPPDDTQGDLRRGSWAEKRNAV
jgi:hypothetical protein